MRNKRGGCLIPIRDHDISQIGAPPTRVETQRQGPVSKTRGEHRKKGEVKGRKKKVLVRKGVIELFQAHQRDSFTVEEASVCQVVGRFVNRRRSHVIEGHYQVDPSLSAEC